ncbi:MAG TPA: putative sulfate exporter family transporter, partial [Candidatus Omnitrophica bacterium]|nr:putative sulfate exporter family transporter [Candidatus Omnitrophota bacterium]
IVIAAFILLVTIPFLGKVMGLNETMFGVWAGTSVHNTPQTIGTGYIFGEKAGQVATMVKLTRNMFMIVIAFLVLVWFRTKKTTEHRLSRKTIFKAFPWFLFGYIGMAVCAVNSFFTPEGISFFKMAGKFLILMGMVGIGFGTDFRDIKRLGVKPLLIGVIGALVVSLVSLSMVRVLNF